ncbi:4,4'-diapophytoene desaturase (4,4'-diapolycopene-forming) [Sinobacterium norvegicum]|uniref:4,4'-diapophytoene desaturase (4,4'-diapolycopene-forming) n=1 Tax=Sinobacterium norvegicum TaxID=1641715 RepID=A0ABN8EI46_9GAMM|nr:NAD(P)/FAD-dependent oxidoreductase [Sinobacterium norvegicum]CAH0992083.1 4,4'-diapophytoene desaturase (4,4'-diapolycopene-forming) [Sinobacterium norvegicum]
MASVRTGKRYRTNRADKHYDAIVVGSGMGGLTNAALLSLLGKKVCVLEQHYTAGGFTHAYERNGYEWDVGVHYVGEVHKPSTLGRIFDVISQGRLKWAEMDPTYDRIILGEQEYDFVSGRENFIEQLASDFPEERQVIEDYVELIRKMSRLTPKFFMGQAMPRLLGNLYNKCRRLLLPKEFFQTTREVLEQLTDNQQLIAVLTGQWGDYGQTPNDAAFVMHALIAKHYLAGGAYPVGGASEIARTIIPTIQQQGGEVFTYAEVDELVVKNNRCVGVRMANGDEIFADTVISNVGYMNTVNRLLPADKQKQYGVKETQKKLQRSSASLGIYAGFKGTTEELGLNSTNLWIYPDADHDGNIKRFLKDPEAEFPLVYVSFPSTKDPSWDERFPGKSTVEIVTITNMDWFEQWNGSTWQQRGEDYEAYKEQLTEKLLEVLFNRLPQLRDALDYCELSTPLSTQFYQLNERGEIYGLDHFVDRFGQSCLHPQTKLKGFYMTGSDVMTAGVGGALMGGLMTTMSMLGLGGSSKVQSLIKNYQIPAEAE